jgi:hypothetical protein
MFWQLTVDCADPERLASFWAAALEWTQVPPQQPSTTWNRHYHHRLDEGETFFPDRVFDPEGLRPPLWFQEVPEGKAGKNRLHLDLYPTGRDDELGEDERAELVDAKVAALVELGATVVGSVREDDPEDRAYFVTMQDPEGNEFCVS